MTWEAGTATSEVSYELTSLLIVSSNDSVVSSGQEGTAIWAILARDE